MSSIMSSWLSNVLDTFEYVVGYPNGEGAIVDEATLVEYCRFTTRVETPFYDEMAQMSAAGLEIVERLLVQCAPHLCEFGIKIKRELLPNGVDSLWAYLPAFDEWFMLVTSHVRRARKNVLKESDYLAAREVPSAFCRYTTNICALMPTTTSGLHTDAKTAKELREVGVRRVLNHDITVADERRVSPFVVIPFLNGKAAADSEEAMSRKAEPERQLLAAGSSVLQDFWDLANLLSRSVPRLADKQPLSEDRITEFVMARNKRSAYRRLFPYCYERKNGDIVWVAGSILGALTGRGGVLRRVRDPRVEGGTHLLLMVGDDLTLDECAFPEIVAQIFNSEAYRAGSPLRIRPRRVAPDGTIIPGTRILVKKFPSSESVVVEVKRYSQVGLRLHDLVIGGKNADCDGDNVMITVLPDDLDVQDLWASIVFGDYRQEEVGGILGGAKDYSTVSGLDEFTEMNRSKRLMGPVTIRARVIASAHDVLRIMDLSAIEIPSDWALRVLGEPFQAPNRPRALATRFGLWVSETAVSKKAQLTLSQATAMLDRACTDWQGAAEEAIGKGGLFATYKHETAAVMKYLFDHKLCFSDLLANPPAQRVLTESSNYWNVPDALKALDTYLLDGYHTTTTTVRT